MNDITKAIAVVKAGGIVIFPTDTAYGIGCRLDDENAIEKLFALRRRPTFQPTGVLVDSLSMAQKYLADPLSDVVRRLIESYWPGGLTIVYTCKTNIVPSIVRGGTDTLGVRMPDHALALQLISGVGVPILGPSANFHGNPTPYSFEELDWDLVRKVDFVLPGECKIKKASTVVDCTVQPFKIIRQGAVEINKEDLL